MSPERRRTLGWLGGLPLLLAACRRSEPLAGPVAGQAWPVIELPGLDGRRRSLGGAGRALLINFWATWCSPCRAEMGGLGRLHAALAPAGLDVVGIAVDQDVNLVREFVLQQRISFPILWDQGSAWTASGLGIRVIPTTVLVGRDGRIAEVAVGAREWGGLPAMAAARALL